MADTPQPPTIHLYERVTLPSGHNRYDMLETHNIETPTGEIAHWAVPTIGDTIGIGIGAYRVTDRMWDYPQRGSAAWPAGHRYADTGPIITVVTEKTTGPFTDEHPHPED